MTETPIFIGTPDDWWEQAEEITTAEARNRTLGCWYITLVRTAGDTKPGYRLSTPSKPANQDQLRKDLEKGHAGADPRVRCLLRSTEPMPEWMRSTFVTAEIPNSGAERFPWVRKKSGRWHCLTDGRLTVNDHTMAELNPTPARFVEGTS